MTTKSENTGNIAAGTPLVVVAVLDGKPGHGRHILDAFRHVSPLVHQEKGCELYAAHLEQDTDTVVMIERWSSREDLEAHAKGEPLALLNRLNDAHLVKPYEVRFLDAVALGDPAKGVIPAAG